MRIRIVSDLHVDVNYQYALDYPKDNTFTVVAGDVSGDPEITSRWISENISKGVFVAGNHIVYNHRGISLRELKEGLAQEFPISKDVSFLDANVGDFAKKIENVLFLGSTLYVDGKLKSKYNPDGIVQKSGVIMENSLNDFIWGYSEYGMLKAQNYFDMCMETLIKFDEDLRKNEMTENLPVVVVTHFCPSMKFIHKYYEDSWCNCAFVSDMEWFIEKHPSIKAWVCGHIHSRIFTEYVRKDSSKCLLLANPRGYCQANEDKDWTPDVFLDTDTWNLVK